MTNPRALPPPRVSRPAPVLAAALIGLALAAAGVPAPGLGQEPPPPQPPAGEFGEELVVTEVFLDVLALNRWGEAVPGLTAADFVVREDGRPVEITGAGGLRPRRRRPQNRPALRHVRGRALDRRQHEPRPATPDRGWPDRAAGALAEPDAGDRHPRGADRRSIFRALLAREPEADWVAAAAIQVRQGDAQVPLRAILASPEFAQRRSNVAAEELLRGIYLGLLGREPDLGAYRTYLDRIRRGAFEEVVGIILRSSEFNQRHAAAVG